MFKLFRTDRPSASQPQERNSEPTQLPYPSAVSLSERGLAVASPVRIASHNPLGPAPIQYDGGLEDIVRKITLLVQRKKSSINGGHGSYRATRFRSSFLLTKRGIFRRTAEKVYHLLRVVLRRNKPSITMRKAAASYDPDETDEAVLQELCGNLLDYARFGSPSTCITASKEIIAIAVEYPWARMTLRTCQQSHSLVNLLGNSSSEISEWASRALFAIEDDHVHTLWSSAVAEPENKDMLQRLSENRAIDEDSQLAETLRNPKSSYLATQYLQRAMKFTKSGPSRSEHHLTDTQGAELIPGQASSTIVEYEEQSEISPKPPLSFNTSPSQAERHDGGSGSQPKQGQQKPKSSGELLKYVLETAPEGSLKDLTETVHVDTKKDRILGRGGFSDVYEGSIPISGKNVVIKLFRLHCEGLDGVKNFAKELRVSSRLKHPNILSPLGYVSRENQEYYIVSELMQKGSLRNCLAEFNMRQLFHMSLGIAEGIRYLHENDVVHGDIKADNVLLSSSNVPLLTDFGLSRTKESFVSRGFYSTESPRGSLRWLAYEYFNHEASIEFQLNAKTDIWAFGMTLLEILTGELPFAHIRSDNRVVTEIATGKLPQEPEDANVDSDLDLRHFVWSVCLRCWNKDPNERPSIHDVLKEMGRYSHSFEGSQH